MEVYYNNYHCYVVLTDVYLMTSDYRGSLNKRFIYLKLCNLWLPRDVLLLKPDNYFNELRNLITFLATY